MVQLIRAFGNEMDNVTEIDTVSRAEEGVSLLDLAIVLAKYKRFIFCTVFIGTVAATLVALVMAPEYSAVARILPPQQQQTPAAAMLGQLGSLASAAGGAVGLKNPADLYIGMIKSRTIADALIEKFDLLKRYDEAFITDARKALERNTRVAVGKDGIISVEVEDTDPSHAAALANAYVEELARLTSRLAVTEAGQRRIFLEKKVAEARDSLARAELSARRALSRGGIAMVDEHGRSLVETTALLRSQLAAKEVQLSSMAAFATEINPEYRRARGELSALRQQIERIENGQSARAAVTSTQEAEGLQNVALLRDIKYYETLLELLSKQLELARIDEAKEGGLIQVLDVAVVPEKKTKPNRTLIIVIAAVASAIVATLVSILIEAASNGMRDATHQRRLSLLRRYLRRT